MAFIEEIPSAQDIKDFDLPFELDLEKPVEERRTWLADRKRDVYLTGVGYTGNPAFVDYEHIKMVTRFYSGRAKFTVILEPSNRPDDLNSDPYIINYPALLNINVYVSAERGMIDVLPVLRGEPNNPHELLQNRSLNEFLVLLKEALTALGAGRSNKYIRGTMAVSFGF